MRPQEKARSLRPYIVKASASLSDGDALEAKELYDYWEANVTYSMGKRLRYPKSENDEEIKLWKVKQTHTSQAQYPPSINTAALYEEVHKPGQGDDPSNPIPYDNNMELIEGKYYSQFDVVYICIRSTGAPVYNNLADLVGIYVEVYV